MSILPKAIYRFNAIPIKILMTFSIELEQIVLKFVWNYKKLQIAKAVLKKKRKDPWFQTVYKAIVIKIVCMLSHFSHLQLCNPMDSSLPGSSSVGFSRQEYWSRFPGPPPGDLLNPGIKSESLHILYCLSQQERCPNNRVLAQKHIDQWTSIGSHEINSCFYVQLILDKGSKNTEWRKDSLFNSFEKTEQLHVKEWNWIIFSHHVQNLPENG